MEIKSTSSMRSLLVSKLLEARQSDGVMSTAAIDDKALAPEDSYAVQQAVVDAIGPVGAFKVANKPDAPRIMAPIFARDVMASPATLAVPFHEDIGIELEIGFRVDAPLPARDAPNRRQRVAGCLSAVAVIEIVRTRLQGVASPLMKLADNQINGGLVVGKPVKDWQSLPMGKVSAFLGLGDERLLDGEATVPGGDAFENFLVFEQMVGNHCGGLRPGQVVITGSLNGLPYTRAETSVLGRIEGLGDVSLHLERRG